MYDYKSLTDQLVATGIVPQTDIYDYTTNELAIVFERHFQYCQKALTEHSFEFDIQPSRFYFRNDFTINAATGKIQDHYIIRVNMGLIVERTFAWIDTNRRTAKNYERFNTTSVAMVHLSAIRIMLNRF